MDERERYEQGMSMRRAVLAVQLAIEQQLTRPSKHRLSTVR